mgnify:CR=1 FL=1
MKAFPQYGHFVENRRLFYYKASYVLENVGKALSIAYQDKTKLLALHKQVTCGKYTPDSTNDPGFLDVVGNDRKYVSELKRAILRYSISLNTF